MKRNIETIALCITASVIAFLVGYGAFVWGFMQGAYELPTPTQTTVTTSQNASQAYNDSAYYLQPTRSTYDIQGNR